LQNVHALEGLVVKIYKARKDMTATLCVVVYMYSSFKHIRVLCSGMFLPETKLVIICLMTAINKSK